MVKNCCVVGCHNVYKKGSGIQFYRFPRDTEKRGKWISAVKREDWIPNDNTWICSVHFVTGARSNNPLAPNYIPTIFPHTESPVKRKLQNSAVRFEQRQAVKRRRVEAAQSSSSSSSSEVQDIESNEPSDVCTASECGGDDNCEQGEDVTTNAENEGSANGDRDVDVEECQQCIKLQKECDKYQQENTKLRLKVISDDFLVDDVKTKYYTGLPSNELLKAVFSFVTIGLPECFKNGPCSVFQQFVMVLMKLRLNLGCQDLGYRFGVHYSTVSRYFDKWLDVLYNRLSVFVHWPERDQFCQFEFVGYFSPKRIWMASHFAYYS